MEEARKSIKILGEICEDYGLEINLNKSRALIFNSKQEYNEIEGIYVEKELKNENKRDIFNGYKKEMMVKGKRLEYMTYGVIEKSCNRLMIGKSFWKPTALPSVLYGSDAVDLNEKNIIQLQVMEYNVYRQILVAPSYVPIDVLRAEIGSSLMKTRVIKGRILYWRNVFHRKN